MGVCAIVSFRLGLSDGVSVVAAAWERAIQDLGWQTYTVAGEGPVDRLVSGLQIDAPHPPEVQAVAGALADADVVLVENLLSIPMNLPASRVVATELTGRPAVLHHHDPPWQRQRFAHITELPPNDPNWRHVTINRLTEQQFADRGLTATTIYNGFDPTPPDGDRAALRAWLGVAGEEILATHPVRAIARKNIPKAVELCENLGATYWLPSPAEEGYDGELDRILAQARCPVIRTPIRDTAFTMSDLYAATDLVLFPSTWEGFGNPPVEAAIHRRLAVVGHYPVADELRAMGFHWFDPDDTATIAAALKRTPDDILERNQRIAREHLSVETMANEVRMLFTDAGWIS